MFRLQRLVMAIHDPKTSRHHSPPPAKFLSQIEGESGPVPVEILAQAKGKDAPNDTLSKFAARYTLNHRAGTLTKESHSGKLVSDWEKVLSDSDTKPGIVDMSPAVSAFMAVKDVEELVSKPRFQFVIHLLSNVHRKSCKNQPR
jgi:nucleosome binding factor SPN SPT16 subunit